MIFVRAAPAWDTGWLVERAHFSPTADFRAIEAVDEETGRIVGMVGYCNWTPNAVEMHLAVESPALCRHLVRPAFMYPFIEAKRGIALASIAGDNERSVRLATHLGFREVGRVKDGIAPGTDIVRLEMRRENCRWLMSSERKAA